MNRTKLPRLHMYVSNLLLTTRTTRGTMYIIWLFDFIYLMRAVYTLPLFFYVYNIHAYMRYWGFTHPSIYYYYHYYKLLKYIPSREHTNEISVPLNFTLTVVTAAAADFCIPMPSGGEEGVLIRLYNRTYYGYRGKKWNILITLLVKY